MSKPDKCLHCKGPLGEGHRAVQLWCAGRERYGRCCRACWSRALLGSLLYRADVCHEVPCRCGWCAEWAELQQQPAAAEIDDS